jgi:hypothetical protein
MTAAGSGAFRESPDQLFRREETSVDYSYITRFIRQSKQGLSLFPISSDINDLDIFMAFIILLKRA